MALSKRARDYGRAILIHSLRSATDSLYSGQHYSTLAHLLGGPQSIHFLGVGQSRDVQDHNSIAVLYDLTSPEKDTEAPGNAAIKCTKFASDEFNLLSDVEASKEPIGKILFLRGFLSAEWIQTVGAKYRIDPDFFQRHLSFTSLPVYESMFALPSLPSSTRNIIRLSVTTIACRDTSSIVAERPERKDIQIGASDAMGRYFRRFVSWAKSGDSIVRGFKILNEHFSILEQDISICLEKDGKGWIAIAWLDSGEALHRSPHGPWIDDSKEPGVGSGWIALPTQQYVKHIALKSMGDPPSSSDSDAARQPIQLDRSLFQQSSTHLPLQYCRFLDQTIASMDFLFATADIFRFAAHSEVQCLNLIASLIEDIVDQSLLVQGDLSDPAVDLTRALLEYKSILEQHKQRSKETLMTLRRRDQSGWPKATKEPYRRKALHEASRLEEDYQYLVSRAEELAAACQDSMAMLMNDAVIDEARKAMEQTERMKKLTMLATFFIPLSFTCTMFGMNVRQFGVADTLSIWVWVAVTVPVVSLTILSYNYEAGALKKKLAWIRDKLNIRGKGQN